MAESPPTDEVNWIGNLPDGRPTFFPEGRRPPRPWVNPWTMIHLGWNTNWADRHMIRVGELDTRFRAHRILTGEGTWRIWVDFMVDILYLARRAALEEAWAEQRGLVLTDSDSE